MTADGIVNGQVQAQLYLAVAQKLQDDNPALKESNELKSKGYGGLKWQLFNGIQDI